MKISYYFKNFGPSGTPAIQGVISDNFIFDSAFLTAYGTEVAKLNELQNVKLSAVVDIFSEKSIIEKPFVEAADQKYIGEYYYPVCPTNAELRAKRFLEIRNLLRLEDITQLYLNYVHYPTFWKSAKPVILDTCYCSRCMALFSAYLGGETLPNAKDDLVDAIDGQYYLEWLEFKCKNITSFVEEVKSLISKGNRNITLGIMLPPWGEKDFGSGITRILGLDLYTLAGLVDVFSPMLFYKTLGLNIEWVSKMLEYYKAFSSVTLIPMIFDEGEDFTEKELEEIKSIGVTNLVMYK